MMFGHPIGGVCEQVGVRVKGWRCGGMNAHQFRHLIVRETSQPDEATV